MANVFGFSKFFEYFTNKLCSFEFNLAPIINREDTFVLSGRAVNIVYQ